MSSAWSWPSCGRATEAAEHYQAVLKTHPQDVPSHNNLGAICIARGQIDEAIAHYRAALESEPAHPGYQGNLGLALEKRGQREEAMQHYRKAVELGGGAFGALQSGPCLGTPGTVRPGHHGISSGASREAGLGGGREQPGKRPVFAASLCRGRRTFRSGRTIEVRLSPGPQQPAAGPGGRRGRRFEPGSSAPAARGEMSVSNTCCRAMETKFTGGP